MKKMKKLLLMVNLVLLAFVSNSQNTVERIITIMRDYTLEVMVRLI